MAHYCPLAGSVFNLGTEKHRRKYLEDIDRLRLPGETMQGRVRCVCGYWLGL